MRVCGKLGLRTVSGMGNVPTHVTTAHVLTSSELGYVVCLLNITMP